MVGPALSAATPTKEFDLAAFAETTDKQAQPRKYFLWGLTAFGVLLVGLGIYLFSRGFSAGQIKTDAAGILVAILGVIGATVSGSSLMGLGASARRLRVSKEGLALQAIPRRPDLFVSWNDSKLKIEIVDVSAWPRGGKGAAGQRPSDYLLRFLKSPYTPIPAEAFHAILTEARNQSLQVGQKKVQDRDGPTVVWTLSS
jgi:hypothetical protein